MQTMKLENAYQILLARAREVLAALPCPADQAENDWRLCHIAISDQIILAAAEAALKGEAAVINNRHAMNKRAIASLIERTTGAERIELVQQCVRRLVGALGEMTDEQAGRTVRLIIHDRNEAYLSTADLTWRELIDLRVTSHIPVHILALRSGGADA